MSMAYRATLARQLIHAMAPTQGQAAGIKVHMACMVAVRRLSNLLDNVSSLEHHAVRDPHVRPVYPPPVACQRTARVRSTDEYHELARRARDDPTRFWGNVASEFTWYKKHDSVLLSDWSSAASGYRVQVRPATD